MGKKIIAEIVSAFSSAPKQDAAENSHVNQKNENKPKIGSHDGLKEAFYC